MRFPVVLREGDAAGGSSGWVYLPVNGWIELVRRYPKVRSKSVIEIKTRSRTYFAHPLPAQSSHFDCVEVYNATFVEQECADVSESECIIGRVWEQVPFAVSIRVTCDQMVEATKIKQTLLAHVVVEGCKLHLANDGASVQILHCDSGKGQPCIFGSQTLFEIVPPSLAASSAIDDYADSGAFKQIFDLVAAARSASWTRPIPRGILLHGPPGVGKTHVVRVVCERLRMPLTTVNGPEVIGSELGVSEENLRKVLTDAVITACPPGEGSAVLFIDEIDSIAPKREDDGEQHQVRLLAQLLTLLDNAPINLIIIGATNRVNAIDPALRRPGRFDREILIEPPSEELRGRIVRTMLAGYPLAPGISLECLAKRTVGYVPADLAALCRELIVGTLSNADGHDQVISALSVERALLMVGPSIKREYRLDVEAGLSWEDIGGLEEIKLKLQKAIQWPLIHSDAFQRLGIKAPRGVLLYGPPGCSKTMIAKVLAHTAGLNFYSLSGAAIYSAYVGEAERLLRQVFSCARMTAPSLIFIDEVDALVGNRGGANADIVQERVLSTLLNEMDGVEEAGRITVLGATNRKDAIDAALLRPGRFDVLIEVGLPTRNDRVAILRTVSRRTPLADDVDFESIADATDGWSGAECKSLIQESAMMAIRRGADRVQLTDLKQSLGLFKK